MNSYGPNLSNETAKPRASRWKRGFFIVWLIFSILWILLLAFAALHESDLYLFSERKDLNFYPAENILTEAFGCSGASSKVAFKKHFFEKIRLEQLEICEAAGENWVSSKLASAGLDVEAHAGLMTGLNLYEIKNKVDEMINQNISEQEIEAYLSENYISAPQLQDIPRISLTKKIRIEGITYIFPADATDKEMTKALNDYQTHMEKLVHQIDIEAMVLARDEGQLSELKKSLIGIILFAFLVPSFLFVVGYGVIWVFARLKRFLTRSHT